jgi:putative membrane protein insertion efficiency factor
MGRIIIILLVRTYQLILSPLKPYATCRFHPTCSCYARLAVERYGWVRGGIKTLRRIARCHPWGGSGEDYP